MAARRAVKAAIRAHQRNLDQRLVYSRDRTAFFSYIRSKTSEPRRAISIGVDGDTVSDAEAADIFSRDFSSNFSAPASVQLPVQSTQSVEEGLLFNSTETAVLEALLSCSNSNSCPDDISFKMLKSVAGCLVRPLNVVFQQCLFEGTFPNVWKQAVIIPLYKGQGDRSLPSSYRPISLCSCLGKLLEKLVLKQLTAFLAARDVLHTGQHGSQSAGQR